MHTGRFHNVQPLSGSVVLFMIFLSNGLYIAHSCRIPTTICPLRQRQNLLPEITPSNGHSCALSALQGAHRSPVQGSPLIDGSVSTLPSIVHVQAVGSSGCYDIAVGVPGQMDQLRGKVLLLGFSWSHGRVRSHVSVRSRRSPLCIAAPWQPKPPRGLHAPNER